MTFEKIKMVVIDVDGVLTDGGMYYLSDGTEAKKFNTRDGKAIELMKADGLIVGFISRENSMIVARRAKKLNVDMWYIGIKNKDKLLNSIRGAHGLEWDQIAYVGDDINDVPAMIHVGLAICPADAVPEVKKIADIVTQAKGGEGVLREIHYMMLAEKKV